MCRNVFVIEEEQQKELKSIPTNTQTLWEQIEKKLLN